MRADTKVPVFRKEQPFLWSPCLLGTPCDVCFAHMRRKKLNTPCERQQMAAPAFTLQVKAAVALVKDGLAEFVYSHRAIRLTFSKIAHLRDRSLKIDEAFLIAYAEGKRWAVAAFDEGWNGTAMLPAREMRDDGRILSFAP